MKKEFDAKLELERNKELNDVLKVANMAIYFLTKKTKYKNIERLNDMLQSFIDLTMDIDYNATVLSKLDSLSYIEQLNNLKNLLTEFDESLIKAIEAIQEKTT